MLYVTKCYKIRQCSSNLTVFSLVLYVVRKSARGKRGNSRKQVQEPPENTPVEEPATIDDMPSSVKNSEDASIKPEIRPEEENLKAEVTSASPKTEIAGTVEEKPNVIKQEGEVTVKESTATEATTEKRAVIKGIKRCISTGIIFHYKVCVKSDIVNCLNSYLVSFSTRIYFYFRGI